VEEEGGGEACKEEIRCGCIKIWWVYRRGSGNLLVTMPVRVGIGGTDMVPGVQHRVSLDLVT
jgi:hypothetical protein